jgi:RAB protein geranylgeranyltransferase component A
VVTVKAVPKMREASIDLIHLLVEVYLARFPETNDEKLHIITSNKISFVTNISDQLFPAKKLILAERECLEHFSDFICTLSKARMEFAMVSVIFELFRVESLTSLTPEYPFFNSHNKFYFS